MVTKETFKEKLIEWCIITPIMFVIGCIIWILYKFGVLSKNGYLEDEIDYEN